MDDYDVEEEHKSNDDAKKTEEKVDMPSFVSSSAVIKTTTSSQENHKDHQQQDTLRTEKEGRKRKGQQKDWKDYRTSDNKLLVFILMPSTHLLLLLTVIVDSHPCYRSL